VIGVLLVLLIVYLIYTATNSTRRKNLWKNIFVVTLFASICAGVVFGVDFFVNKVLQEHQRNRVMVLIDQELDPRGVGYHVRQSKIAIGSGEFWGKGYLQGTQTKFDFVPEQSTDFIFCTIGEEHGWLGSTILIGLYIAFLLRLVFLAERQKDKFARIYGYSVACLIFIHFMVNIGMTIGLFPVIGIPLPFFSYGGSSLWSFTILLFIFLKLDAHRGEVLTH
jgi:rod shape determining protein RodA